MIVPGDAHLTRSSSDLPAADYGELLKRHPALRVPSGDDPREALMVDGTWAVIEPPTSTNRSFEHNDEVNVAFRRRGVTARLKARLRVDLAASDEVTAERCTAGLRSKRWSVRSAGLERQQ